MREVVQLIEGDDAEVAAQVVDVPVGPAQQLEPEVRAVDRVDFPRDGLDERGLPGAVRAQERHMLAPSDLQGEIAQDIAVAARDGQVLEIEEQGRSHGIFNHRCARINTDKIRGL